MSAAVQLELPLVIPNEMRVGVGHSILSKKVETKVFATHTEFLEWLASPEATCKVIGTDPKSGKLRKDGVYLTAPMRDNRRNAANAEAAWHMCLDLDDVNEAVTAEKLRAALESLGYSCVFHPTTNSTPDSPRWRVVFLLASAVAPTSYGTLHHVLESAVRKALDCSEGAVDKTAGRPEQPQFVRPEGAELIVVEGARPLYPEALFTAMGPDPYTTQENADEKEPHSESTEYTDPVVRRFAELNLLRGSLRPGMWAVKCPWSAEHTSPPATDGSDVVLFEPNHGGYGRYGFKCHHAHCAKRKFKPDVMEAIGLTPTTGAIWDTDLMNARRFALRYRENLRFSTEQGWLAYDGRRWVVDRLDVAMRCAKEFAEVVQDDPTIQFREVVGDLDKWAKRTQSTGGLKAMMTLAQSEPGIPAHIAAFDSNPLLFNCRNGTIDLESGKLRPHRRDDLITKLCDIDYDRNADCPLWDEFLFKVLGGEEDLYGYVQRAVGLCLSGLTDEQVFFFCHGGGANGKSVFLETNLNVMGEYASTARTELLMSRTGNGIPNDLAALRGQRFVAVNETADNQRFNEPVIKDLVGGDAVTARFLFKEFFSFRPEFKLWLRGNHKPAIYGTDHGIWRRVHLIPFNVTIPPEERDPALIRKLWHERAGILAWAVDGFLKWKRHGLMPPAVVLQAVEEYRREQDAIGNFLDECTERQADAVVKAGDLYLEYKYWAQAGGEFQMSMRKFGTSIHERGFTRFRTEKGVHYRGLRLKVAGHALGAGRM